MFIVLQCGGIPFNGETIKTGSLGGSESAAYYLAKDLAKRGHRVTMFTNTLEEGEWDGVKYFFTGEATNEFPQGNRFHFYCSQTPHDVNIIQRHPASFQHKFASKVNLLWLHDIGLIRNAPVIMSTMWNVDQVMTVSQFHKDQIMEDWKLEDDIITPITNGVDRALYKNNTEELPEKFSEEGLVLLYQSRPERGLEALVSTNGIMEQLLEKRPDARLHVCGYKHDVPAMQDYYDGLYARIEELPNCTNLGFLPKNQLAQVQKHSHLLVYPTTFEEVSCITVMEAMNAGLPVVASKFAALPETCKGAGVDFINNDGDNINVKKFADKISKVDVTSNHYKRQVELQYAAAKKYTWEETTNQVLAIIQDAFDKTQNPTTMVRDLIRNSDIIAVEKYIDSLEVKPNNPIFDRCLEELELYKFTDSKEAFDAHYQKGTDAFYDGDFQRVGREVVEGRPRFEIISSYLDDLESGSEVIDYGCAHGHITIGLAKRFPEIHFTGIDISSRAIQEATKWAGDDKVENISWYCGTAVEYAERQRSDVGDIPEYPLADAIIAAEVLEHVRDPQLLMQELRELTTGIAKWILTTPYGPWEEMSYQKDHPTRFHLHHFERADIYDMFYSHSEFDNKATPCGTNPSGQSIGQYITSFRDSEGTHICMPIDYERKLREWMPKQTVSLCMIVKDGEHSVGKALRSIEGYLDELIVSIDENTTDDTESIVDAFMSSRALWPVVSMKSIESPLETGFDEARNTSMEDAVGDWILWFDHDEEVIEPHSIGKLLRNNQFKGYPLPQTHFSIRPLEVLNTDFPVRLFRNNENIKFYGVVHEHPETGLNEGIGAAWIQNSPVFSHNGYITEEVRRSRFDRNFPLMQRDREKYPDRILGKFLWVRDVAHACQFHLEDSNGQVIPEMQEAASQAIEIWKELMETDQIRMIEDSMKYYSVLAQVLGADLTFGIRMGQNRLNGPVDLSTENETNCRFLNPEHVTLYVNKLISERMKGYETKHF